MSTKSKTGSNRKTPVEDHSLSEAYYQELLETFQLFSNKDSDKVSIKGLQRAMRTLGFDATLNDIKEIVKGTPMLSIHKGKKKRQGSNKDKGATAGLQDNGNSNYSPRSTRSSSKTTLSRTGRRSKYVDSDEGGPSDGDDDDDDDIYQDGSYSEGGNDKNNDDLWFTLQDFIILMSPSEEEHRRDEISRVFQLFDVECRGSIRVEDLRRVAGELGISIKDHELQEMIEEADRDGDGGVSEQDFARIMKKSGF
ncbi:hypothetical protein FBU30_005421 [Linnemannia zychae]|nr:hypothetical protein FBU30_005421 [Linnemannia zychae]